MTLPIFISKADLDQLPNDQSFRYVTWDNDTMVLFDTWKQMAARAKELARDAGARSMYTTESRSDWDGNSYSEPVTDWFQVAKLLHHVMVDLPAQVDK